MRSAWVVVGSEEHLLGEEVTPGSGVGARSGWRAARRCFSMQMHRGALRFGSLQSDGWRRALPETFHPFEGSMDGGIGWSIPPCHS